MDNAQVLAAAVVVLLLDPPELDPVVDPPLDDVLDPALDPVLEESPDPEDFVEAVSDAVDDPERLSVR